VAAAQLSRVPSQRKLGQDNIEHLRRKEGRKEGREGGRGREERGEGRGKGWDKEPREREGKKKSKGRREGRWMDGKMGEEEKMEESRGRSREEGERKGGERTGEGAMNTPHFLRFSCMHQSIYLLCHGIFRPSLSDYLSPGHLPGSGPRIQLGLAALCLQAGCLGDTPLLGTSI
jgi:hypothetical protein